MSRSPHREFAFAAWDTPFKDQPVILEQVNYANGTVTCRVDLIGNEGAYLVTFTNVSAFRVLDEHGLLEVWEKTSELGGRPARTCFKIKDSAWTSESVITFLASDGWSFMIATDFDCLEVVATDSPEVRLVG